MPSPDAPPLTRGAVLRGVGFAAAIALGAIAVWLIVTSTSQKRIEIGILTGLWGLLLGAYSMFGARRAVGPDSYDEPGREVAVRENRTVERSDDAQARRDWEARLERLIQREIGTAVSRETAALRSEIAHLRQELLEKVGGQIRLERIETTRLIGSDLEALQHEVRQLKVASGNLGVKELLGQAGEQRIAVRQVVEPARVRPVSRPTAEVEADIRPAQRAATEDVPVANAPIGARPAQAAPARTVAPPAAAAPVTAPLNPRREPAEPRPAAAPTLQPARADQVRLAPTQRPAAPAPAAATTTAATTTAATPPAKRDEPTPPRSVPGRPTAPAEPVRAANGARPATPPAPTANGASANGASANGASANGASANGAERPTSTRGASEDPFASLPRIRPFTDFALEPTDTPAPRPANGANGTRVNGVNGANGAGSANGATNGATNGAAGLYTGRRRRSDDDAGRPDHESGPATTPAPAPAAPRATAHATPESAGGRRRRNDGHDDGSDLLARLLARESVDR